MRRIRHMVAILALFGVLLHAGALVRHTLIGNAAHQAVADDQLAWCDSGDHAVDPDAVSSKDPTPKAPSSHCPLCAVGGAVAAALPVMSNAYEPSDSRRVQFRAIARQIARKVADHGPLSRGPPAANRLS